MLDAKEPETADRLLDRVTEIVVAFISRNDVQSADLTSLIVQTHHALSSLSKTPTYADLTASSAKPKAAVPIAKSIAHDHLVCLEDGQKFKFLKRHLNSSHKMTPEQYRAKWQLPASYPMVAPEYSQIRSAISRSNNFGRRHR